MNKIRIGLDISYNSTGITILHPNKEKPIWYQLCPESSKHSASIYQETYQKVYTGDKEFSENELDRIKDSESIALAIISLIRKYTTKEDELIIRIEAPLDTTFMKGSKQLKSAKDMATLNKIVTFMMTKMSGAKVSIHTARTIKKKFTGKGNGKKELVLEKFFEIFPNFDNKGKVDDIADSYALAYCEF